MSQQVPQQPHVQYQPQMQPPKKKHTARNVFIVIGVLFLLGVGGCFAIVGSVGNSVSKSIDEDASKNAPRPVTVGTAFTLGKHETLAGWTVKNESGMFTVTGKVKNTSKATSSAFLHLKFLTATGEVLGNVGCNSADLEPGQTQVLNCIPDGKFGKYTKITAEATF
ncbi:hypothetical protein GCM10009554_30340 [Kribbella koreensis]|uniref:DUF4352 domain-containing protein n=2 Tax=Kribbella TaxID=182639 RepID=A0ABP6YPY7_9ACTN